MKSLIIKGLYKTFPINKSESFTALSNINLSFLETGFNSIVGKSGSGKTTLLNMISCFDKPSKGEIYLYKKRYNYKSKKLYLFYQNEIAIISQQYHLIENLTVLENVMMPLIINGYSRNKARKKAIEALQFVNIPSNLFENKCNNLSGGECQRVAIARAIVRKPKMILCDEPTGALDYANSIKVMELLSKISKSTLIIMVSHNLQLVEKYSDRIIELSEGKIINDRAVKKIDIKESTKEVRNNRHTNWTSRFSLSNFHRRIKRNILVMFSLSISMMITTLMVGFLNGKDLAIKNASYQQLDFGQGTISKDEIVSDTGIIKLTKSVRPDLESLKRNNKIVEYFHICPNFSAILPSNIKISAYDSQLDGISYSPIYNYSSTSLNDDLLSLGSYPKIDSLNEVIINTSCYELIKANLDIEPLNCTVTFSHFFESIYVDEFGQEIKDVFQYNISSRVTAVVDELSYLNTPKIYYSYEALISYLQEYSLINLSTYNDYKITWYDRVMNAEDYSIMSSYSYHLFLKDYRLRNILFDEPIFTDYSFNSSSLIIANSLIGFLNAAEYALFLFLAIGLIGSLLILAIISFTNYSEDRKISAILTSLGARNTDIENIYVNENLFSGFISLLFSLVISYPLSLLINSIIYKFVSIKDMIVIPYFSFWGLFPLLSFAVVALLISFSTLLPIKFSKKRSLSLELKVND